MKRTFICLTMVLVMLFGFSATVSAEELHAVEQPIEVQEDAISKAGCNHAMWTWECRKNFIGSEIVTHGYGLFWANTCTSTVKKSTVRNFCYQCGDDMWWYDTNDQHECKQIHKNCGKGTQDICMIIGQY